MKPLHIFTLLALGLFPVILFSQAEIPYSYEPSNEHPFGLPNPDAPEQVKDFAPLIGECECSSTARGADQQWGAPTPMIWRFKYIMNGNGVQDETLKEDGIHSGSIRQFNADSSKWYVHYYSTRGIPNTLPTWEGTKREEGNIILYRDSPSPNGDPGYYRITFYDISEKGFNWIGEWVDKAETIQYPLWKINCKKVKS